MVVERKYPTHVYAYDSDWNTPDYVLNAADGLCANIGSIVPFGTEKIFVETFGFNIPSNAIISKITLGIDGCQTVAKETWTVSFWWRYAIAGGIIDLDVYSVVVGANCAGCVWKATDFTPSHMPTPAQCNNIAGSSGDRFAWVQATDLDVGLIQFFADAVYIEITYTVPSAWTPQGDGLVEYVGGIPQNELCTRSLTEPKPG